MSKTPLAFEPHDHSACTGDLLAHAETQCARVGARLTPVRRRTLEILSESHRAMGAYDVLARLSEDGFGGQPPVAYRALEFLVEHGLAHKVRRLNAFTACVHPGTIHSPAFFICRECDGVAESAVPDVSKALDDAAKAMGFKPERTNLEVLGLCPVCRQ